MNPLKFMPLAVVLSASTAFAATPVLRVNDAQLTDVDLKLAGAAVGRQMQGMQASDDAVLRHSLDQLIGRTLLLQAARDAKVFADPKSVAANVEAERRRAGGPEAFQKDLAKNGLTEQDVTRIEEESQVVRKFVEGEIEAKVRATEADAKGYFDTHPQEFQHPEQVKLRVLLVPLGPGADEKDDAAAKARADEAHKRIAAGEDFAKVAQQASNDPTKARGGEVGWVRKGVLLPELETAVWALKAGEVSPVLKAKYGYHVFKVDDRRAAGPLAFDEVKQTLMKGLHDRQVNEGIGRIIAERRAKAKIEALDPKVKAALEALQAAAKPAASAQPSAPAAGAPAAKKPGPDAPKKP